MPDGPPIDERQISPPSLPRPETHAQRGDVAREAACGLPAGCDRIVPWPVVIWDNLPTLLMYGLGAAIIRSSGPDWMLAYLAYAALATLLFWTRICPACPHYGTRACPCGYGILAKRLLRLTPSRRPFRRVFRRNIWIVFPLWFAPMVAGVWRIWRVFDLEYLGLLVAFAAVGFGLVPLAARAGGCRSCGMRDQCPWMSRASFRSSMGK